jgi:hypothetical protein
MLERIVLPTFSRRRDAFSDVMRHAIALNGAFFTAQRMLQEYVSKTYNLEPRAAQHLPSSGWAQVAAIAVKGTRQ